MVERCACLFLTCMLVSAALLCGTPLALLMIPDLSYNRWNNWNFATYSVVLTHCIKRKSISPSGTMVWENSFLFCALDRNTTDTFYSLYYWSDSNLIICCCLAPLMFLWWNLPVATLSGNLPPTTVCEATTGSTESSK